MSEKYNAALGAYELIAKEESPLVLGIGTGSTTDYFTKNFLPNLSNKLKCIYSSSYRTTSLLNDLGFMVKDYDQNAVIDIYVDGADEVDENLNLIKGGGGAHTNEKRLAIPADPAKPCEISPSTIAPSAVITEIIFLIFIILKL